jgi:hypothetical protein
VAAMAGATGLAAKEEVAGAPVVVGRTKLPWPLLGDRRVGEEAVGAGKPPASPSGQRGHGLPPRCAQPPPPRAIAAHAGNPKPGLPSPPPPHNPGSPEYTSLTLKAMAVSRPF